jgi:hypothetical protein
MFETCLRVMHAVGKKYRLGTAAIDALWARTAQSLAEPDLPTPTLH